VKIALLTPDMLTGAVLQTLLKRAGLAAAAFRIPSSDDGGELLAARVESLRDAFAEILVVGQEEAPKDARSLEVTPSLEAWLTRDAAANRAVLGTPEVPPPSQARDWLRERIVGADLHRFAMAVEGRALAAVLDLGRLAAFAPAFRSLVTTLHPTWATVQQPRRAPGRPPGVSMFRGAGYTLCLELLHRGERAEVTVAELMEVIRRTKTPILRLIQEAQRRGYLRRTSARGPLIIRNTERLLDDMVTDAKARNTQQSPATLPLGTDRDAKNLPARLGHRLAEHGRVMALTGARALLDEGGDQLLGGSVVAYTSLVGIEPMLGDAFVDRLAPRVILVEPREEGFFHRLRQGSPSLVSPWQAAIDLLASHNDRERQVGAEVRAHLLGRTA
jgi:hypothetical protein